MDAGILGALIGATATLVTAVLAYAAAQIQFRGQKRFDHGRVVREERAAAYHAFLNEVMLTDSAMRALSRRFAGLSLGEMPDRATRIEELRQFAASVHRLAASVSSIALVGPDPVWHAARDLYHEFTYSDVALGMVCSADADECRRSCLDHFDDGLVALQERRDEFIDAARVILGTSPE
ncbi:hypothetical protein [Streptomyces sp. NEAU-174]|uniref:hypothetical protein n=1 Tax=Streptomyces sp. NEAU-174 TaxID=3458254 RepID=UPI0040440049